MIHFYLLALAALMLLMNLKAGSRTMKIVSYWVMWWAVILSVGIAISSYIETGGITV